MIYTSLYVQSLTTNNTMNNSVLSVPTLLVHRPEFANYNEAEEVSYEEVFEPSTPYVNFLESNTDAISMEDLRKTCIVPCWGNQELTISHQDFINTVEDAVRDFYQGETFTKPQIRVSHEVKGRIPSALHKKANELLESDKTKFYQRLAFAMTIPSIHESINGQKMELCVCGVRNYSDLNLYRSNKGLEKFSVAIGWRVNVCSNQVLTTDGLKSQMEVSNLNDLYRQVLMLLNSYMPAKDLHLMQSLTNTYLTEQQFANVVGRCRLYQALPPTRQRFIPRLLITDSQINNCCRGFYNNPDFGGKDNSISLWDFHNLLTESNKQVSYIDSYLQRAVNATELAVGLNNSLQGIDNRYDWFLN